MVVDQIALLLTRIPTSEFPNYAVTLLVSNTII